jgi:hypothetical protein
MQTETERHTQETSMTAFMNRFAPTTLTVVSLALLGACGNSLSGTYGKKGEVNFEFHSNGKVELDILGPIQEANYVVEDGKVKISGAQGTMVLRIDDKGCLDGGVMMGKLCKQ